MIRVKVEEGLPRPVIVMNPVIGRSSAASKNV
jgi:hypothetical protein